jgi:hypothetical protein
MGGLKKHESTLPSLLIGGTAVQTASVVVALQARIDAANAAVAARATWQAAVSAARDERAKSSALLQKVRQALHLAFDGNGEALADFGLTPRKARVVSPATKVVAAAKAKATRVARHTMGTKQKKGVKATGTVTVTLGGADHAAGAAPSGTPTPAAAATAAPAPAPVPAPAPKPTG